MKRVHTEKKSKYKNSKFQQTEKNLDKKNVANTLESFPLLHNKTKEIEKQNKTKTEQKRIQLSATEYTHTNKNRHILAKTLDFLKTKPLLTHSLTPMKKVNNHPEVTNTTAKQKNSLSSRKVRTKSNVKSSRSIKGKNKTNHTHELCLLIGFLCMINKRKKI